MNNALARMVSAAGLGGTLLAGCASQPGHRMPPIAPGHTASAPSPLTGIPACDAYLASYLACHRAAGTYPTGQLWSRYRSMRDTLLREAHDPVVRPYLGSRCASMSDNLRSSLHGRSCADRPIRDADAP